MQDQDTNASIRRSVDKYDNFSKSPDKKKKEVRKEAMAYFKIVISAVAIAVVLVLFIIMNAKVPSGSMKDTINEGDRIVGLRLAYAFSSPKRGDIIIFKYPDNESTKYVKRVIGLPGDTVSFKDGDVYINGEKLNEPYLKTQHSTYTSVESYTVPEGSYFMLGDNRENSKDSRFWNNTYVKKQKILAKVMFRYYNGETHRIDFAGL
ncbi:MAG: signal peptidase I [Clostridiales bacterium]|nr:signal peptidase I [Clostridiales bacterium]MBS5877877.1 signal peptidase I [Clostridiales bacterium]MDU3490874.1 signal peptidase I [Clostridiales bacterium]